MPGKRTVSRVFGFVMEMVRASGKVLLCSFGSNCGEITVFLITVVCRVWHENGCKVLFTSNSYITVVPSAGIMETLLIHVGLLQYTNKLWGTFDI